MTPKQILDSFSETLMQDERILSAPERALLATLLQHAKSAAGNAETRESVRAVIASAVGETVAQRAFGVLGSSIVERILESGAASANEMDVSTAAVLGPKDPQPPNKEPQPPGVKAPPKPVHQPVRTPPSPAPEPQPPRGPQPPREPQPPRAPMRTPGVPVPPGEPQPPGHGISTTVVSQSSVAVTDRPSSLPAQSVVLDEFLAPQELEELTRYAMERESAFRTSEVVSPSADEGIVNYEHRRSHVLMDLGPHEEVMLKRIKSVLPQVLANLGMEEFAITGAECQITASNDGDFFHFHSDNGSERVASRRLTFVYFFHQEPRQFNGGELRIHDARLVDGAYVSEGSYQAIAPQQNQIVFFPCELLHEITPVECPSGRFADSRFTLNGWLHR